MVNLSVKAVIVVLGLVLLLSLSIDVTSIRSVRLDSRQARIAPLDGNRDEWQTADSFEDKVHEQSDAKHVDIVTPVPTKSPTPAPQSGKVLCIQGPFWGQTFNRIIQTANALTLANERQAAAVGLDTKWTEWYDTFLDRRTDLRFNYTGPCTWSFTPQEIFRYYKFDMLKSMKYLQVLIPKVSHRNEAHAAMAELPRPVTTVHRRNLEGKCIEYAQNYTKMVCANWKSARNGLSVQNLVDICNLDYHMIANATTGTSVVLLTDAQVPALDQTFPFISNHSFPVQTWMMALSDVHYGNPFSTVDLIVHHWRVGLGKATSTRPSACYRPATGRTT